MPDHPEITVVGKEEEESDEPLDLDIPELSDDPEELREQLTEYGPKVLAEQLKIALAVSQRIVRKLKNPKTKIGRDEAVMMGIAIDKMAKSAQLLQQLAPTRFDIINEVPFPGMRCPKCDAQLFDGDMSGFDEDEEDNGGAESEA